MGKYILIMLLSILSVSCRNAWNQADDTVFKKACLDEAKAWTPSPENAETYCNCVIAEVHAKYSSEDEALKNIDVLSSDKDLLECKDSLTKK